MIQVTVAKDHALAAFQNLSGFLEEEQTVADSGQRILVNLNLQPALALLLRY